MPSELNIVIVINQADAQSGDYPVQLWNEGKPLAEVQARIDRQKLLEHEHKYSAHEYGMELYSAVFAGKVGEEYQRLVGRVGIDTPVRVQLVIAEKARELHVLPWERLFSRFGDTDDPMAASAPTPFSRFLVTGAGDQTSVQERRLRLLLAISNPETLPQGLPEIDVAGEVTALADLLVELGGRVVGTVLPGRSGLPTGLRQRLEQEGWAVAKDKEVTSWGNIQRHLPGQHVLHILAHGQFKQSDSQAYLLLEDEGGGKAARGSIQRTADQVIVDGLAGVRPLPQLIFLAACESATRPEAGANPFVGLGPKLVQAGVPAVVAMQDLVPMDLARTVAADFYRRLFAHGQVDRALNEARSLVYKRSQFEWAIPVLFLRLKDGQLFSTTPIELRKALEPEMVFVRGGPFLMGSHPTEGVPEAETPQHRVELGDYYIGKYPVTNQEYAEFIKQVKTQDVPKEAGWFNRKPPSDRLDYPVTGVSWHDTVAYCVWLSKATGRRYRLPSEAEWEKAARGPHGRRYPWDGVWDNRYANVGSQGPTQVTSHPLGASSFGCQDMVGNVEEWTRTLWGNQWTPPEFGYPFDAHDGRELMTAGDLPALGKVVHRGGSYRLQVGKPYCALRDCADPRSKIAWRGFRVVMEV
jgi:formylglycine-generating enzyme required for sulfatase activity